MAYIQLLSPKGDVLAQRSLQPGQPLSFYSENVWRVPKDHTLKVVQDSSLVQPYKFMYPIRRDSEIFVYHLSDSMNALPSEPSRSLAYMKYKAWELEEIHLDDQENLKGWNAFADGKWVGTSEY